MDFIKIQQLITNLLDSAFSTIPSIITYDTLVLTSNLTTDSNADGKADFVPMVTDLQIYLLNRR